MNQSAKMGADRDLGVKVAGLLTANNGVEGVGQMGRPRLSAVLLGPESRRFESIVTLPSNVQAVESALLFATCRTPFVVLVGPSGWGKSHLIEAAAHTMHALDRTCTPQVVTAKEWAQSSNRIDPMVPLLVDDLQGAIGQQRSRHQMRFALERRVRAGKPTLLAFSSLRATRALKAFLPNPSAWVVATIEPPDREERLKLVSQMSKAQGLALSESLQRILAKHLLGDGRTLEGAFKRLRLQDSRLLDAHASLRALGILNPFFSDNSDWDLREAILEAAEGRCKTSWNRELAAYVMVDVALLAEADVAHFFEVEPSVVYARKVAFQKRLDTNEDVRTLTRQFIEEVVDRLGAA